MKALRQRFSGLRTRLTLTYTLVTVGALLALLIVLLSGVFTLIVTSGANDSAYLGDVQFVLGSRATDFVSAEDIEGLQDWMERRFASGFASEQPADFFDSAAARFAVGVDFYAIDENGRVIAQAPEPVDLGQTVPLPSSVDEAWFMNRLQSDILDPLDHSQRLPDGNLFFLFPLEDSSTHLGSMVVTVEPPPPFFLTNLPFFGGVVAFSAIALLIGVAPFGALFGYIMARNITRRLANLETVADAYSQGDFTAVSQDSSQDEIGRLGQRLKQMAQQIETLLQNRQDFALLEERNRLARDLHDTVKQQNFATMMQVRAAKNLAQQERDPEVALGHLETAENLLKQSQEDLKAVIEELRPVQLEGRGLPAALKQFLHDWSAQNNVPADLVVADERPLSITIEQPLYRVAQEALSNIARHSGATAVKLNLAYHPKTVSLTIHDNGQGFDLDNTKRGFGLSTMQQRVAKAGGQFEIESGSKGTTITAIIET